MRSNPALWNAIWFLFLGCWIGMSGAFLVGVNVAKRVRKKTVTRQQLVDWFNRDQARLNSLLAARADGKPVLEEELVMVRATIIQLKAEVAFEDAKANKWGWLAVKADVAGGNVRHSQAGDNNEDIAF